MLNIFYCSFPQCDRDLEWNFFFIRCYYSCLFGSVVISHYTHCMPGLGILILFVCPVPQNDLDDPERGMIFVCSATHKTKSMFFFLAQTEQGDIFKVTLETDEEMVSAEKQKGAGGDRMNRTVSLSRNTRL